MSTKDLKYGSATLDDFIYWMNERHNIYVNRFKKKLSKPWTGDQILQTYAFTNVFRQLDKGTITLTKMLKDQTDLGLILFNIFWYRTFNRFEHGDKLGFVDDYKILDEYINMLFNTRQKIFTGAHYVYFPPYEEAHIAHLKRIKEIWDKRDAFANELLQLASIEKVRDRFLQVYAVGPFVAYEFTCDCRFTKILEDAPDKLTWASMGPGSQRGLYRLGRQCNNQYMSCYSMVELYHECLPLLSVEICTEEWPFELREIEHSLCEFDKYQRVLKGEGRPRKKFNGI